MGLQEKIMLGFKNNLGSCQRECSFEGKEYGELGSREDQRTILLTLNVCSTRGGLSAVPGNYRGIGTL